MEIMRAFGSYLRTIRTMKDLVEKTTESFKTDLDHDFAAIMTQPDMTFLWGPYSSGTYIVRLEKGNYNLADSFLRHVEREKDGFQWYYLDPAQGELGKVDHKEARRIVNEFTT